MLGKSYFPCHQVTLFRQGNPLESLRPEYIEAVAASRWNLWLIPLFFLPPLLFALLAYRGCNAWLRAAAVIGCIILTWFSLWFYSEVIWTTMELHAQTGAEWNDVTSDTGRVLGPILVGIPFAVTYTLLWWGTCSSIGWTARFIRRKSRAG